MRWGAIPSLLLQHITNLTNTVTLDYDKQSVAALRDSEGREEANMCRCHMLALRAKLDNNEVGLKYAARVPSMRSN